MKALQFIGNRLRAVKNSDEKAEFIINQDFIHYLQNPNE